MVTTRGGNKIDELGLFTNIPRKDFGKSKEIISLPDLIMVQSRSFNDFVQLDYLSSERKNSGLEKVLRDIFPIEHADKTSLEYVGYELGDWSCVCGTLKGIEERYSFFCTSCSATGVGRCSKDDKCKSCSKTKLAYKRCNNCHSRVTLKANPSAENCRYSGKTFSLPLKVRLRLVSWDTQDLENKFVRDIKVQDVFFCSLPVMVDHFVASDGSIMLGSSGTFIINGVDRVVVSQVHRAPGVLFVHNKKSKDFRGDMLPSARLIPARGVWLDFEFDSKDVLWVKADKKKKMLATTFLQAIGLSREEIIESLYASEKIEIVNGGFFKKIDASLIGYRLLKNDIPKKLESVLSVGVRVNDETIKLFKKHGIDKIEIKSDFIANKFASKTFIDQETGEVLLEPGESITPEHIDRMGKISKGTFFIIDHSGYLFQPSIAITLSQDSINSYQKAVAEVYARIRSGDLPPFEAMVESINSAFFNPRYYDLTKVGRIRINRKLDLKTDPNQTCLTKEDIVATVKYLLGIKERGQGAVDNSDHLANKCVRLVGELIQNQLYIAFSRIEKIIRERFRTIEISASTMPYNFINVKPMVAILNSFFGTGQLSQFMDQTNPLAEMAHKRRLSALGPGGISRETASLEVRDVQPSHYGRICTIETPDGHNIGLISSLASYANVNELGFLETPYRVVKNGVVQKEVVLLDAYQEMGKVIADAKVKINSEGKMLEDSVLARKDGDIKRFVPEKVDYIDASPRQLVSVATSMIPFLENDDANRALMGSNMQRQAVPVICPEAPMVGTGMEIEVGYASSSIILSKGDGVVRYVSADKILVEVDRKGQAEDEWIANPVEIYHLRKFAKSSHNTWINQQPVVKVGQQVHRGSVLTSGSSVENSELALGRNVLIAFMPWSGYNFEDAIAISERLVYDNVYTSVHIEEFSVEARDTKLGAEEITRDIPNISEREMESLDEDGIVRIGTRVVPGDILVGKVTLKGDVQVSPEEKLLRAIFGDKSREVRDTSSRVPPGINGTVIDVKVFSRSGVRKDRRYKEAVDKSVEKIDHEFEKQLEIIRKSLVEKLRETVSLSTSAALKNINKKELDAMSFDDLIKFSSKSDKVKKIKELYEAKLEVLKSLRAHEIAYLRRGDDLPSGVIKMVRVYISMKRTISVGDKMVGRHGNKGVISRIFNIEDMPYLENGKPVDIVLNPLGVPGRMNLGQILETMMGMACKKIGEDFAKKVQNMSDAFVKKSLIELIGKELVDSIEEFSGIDGIYKAVQLITKKGLHIRTPVFDGADFAKDVCGMLEKAGLSKSGKYPLFDGRSGEKFMQPVMVGYMYMMKLNHMVDDKIHARSVGPYSLITQQPLGGKAKFGGQRLGEMEVWALLAYGSAYTLQEMLTIKSDDIIGRSKTYDAIVHGDEVPVAGLPESFNVLVKELQSLGLQIDLFESDRELVQ